MSDKDQEDKGQPDAEAEVPAADAESAPEPQVESPAGPVADLAETRRPGNSGIAWLALLASLIALVGVAYSIFSDWQSAHSAGPDPLVDIRDRMAASDDTLSTLEAQLTELETANGRLASQLETMRGDIDNRLQLLDALPPRLANLETSMAALQGISSGARNTWLVAEAEYYLQIANAQMQLAGNPHLAGLALGMADERIVQLADPALTGVRRAIADEQAAIEAMGNPDIEGLTLTLASLARVVAGLPIPDIDARRTDAEAAPGTESSGLARAWAAVKTAASRLVRISSPDEVDLPLVAPEAEYFLRTNLTLQLQTARLALLRGESAAFEQSLDDASAWLKEYFDTDSTQVRSALATIGELRNETVAVAKPDISESLRLLRQYKALAEPSE